MTQQQKGRNVSVETEPFLRCGERRFTAGKRNTGGNGDTRSNLREEAFQVC